MDGDRFDLTPSSTLTLNWTPKMVRTADAGSEPTATLIQYDAPGYNEQLIRSMNWYTMDKDDKDARNYLRQYVKGQYPSKVKEFDGVPDNKIVNTFGWLARLSVLGATLSPIHINRLNTYIEGILTKPKSVSKPIDPTTPRRSVYDYTQEKAAEYIGELEGVLDEENFSFNLLNDLKAKSIPQPYVPHIQKWVKQRLLEFITVFESKELLDGYHWTKAKARNMAKLMGTFNEDLEKYATFRKANRKPRAKKVKPPTVQIKALKYKSKDEELNIQSISPLEVVGASQVWFYNTKTKKLSVYKTESSTGIQVKGTTLQNYEPELSSMKTLRKPLETITNLQKAGKVQLRKFMEELSTKGQEVNGRINTDMLIVRAIK